MTRLGAAMSEAIVHHYGREELLRRLAHPFRFQSFGAVMGMDWHSSGITTSMIGALKRGLTPLSNELGIHLCSGRGNILDKRRKSLSQSGSGWALTDRRSRTQGPGASFHEGRYGIMCLKLRLTRGAAAAAVFGT